MSRMRTTIPIQNEILRLKGVRHNKTRVAKLMRRSGQSIRIILNQLGASFIIMLTSDERLSFQQEQG